MKHDVQVINSEKCLETFWLINRSDVWMIQQVRSHFREGGQHRESLRFGNSKELVCVGYEQKNSPKKYNRLLVLVRRSACRHEEMSNHASPLLLYSVIRRTQLLFPHANSNFVSAQPDSLKRNLVLYVFRWTQRSRTIKNKWKNSKRMFQKLSSQC
jgi:hypothetical protein